MSDVFSSVVDTYSNFPTTALLMSGTGTNARAILNSPELRDLYNITTIITDNLSSNANEIADEFETDYVAREVGSLASDQQREDYFGTMGEILEERGVSALFYAGFMKISTPSFCERFPGVNVHPADLTYKDQNGLARFRGMNSLSVMRATLGHVRASVHTVETPVDSGAVLALTREFKAGSSVNDDQLHAALRTEENVVYPRTLIRLGRGEIAEPLPDIITEVGND